MDPSAILTAVSTLSLPALILAVMGGVLWGGIKVIGWGSEVTKLLGNHLRHDLADQTDTLRRIETTLNEQTLVLRALGRMIMESQTGKNSIDRRDF